MTDNLYSGYPPAIAVRLLDIFRHSGWSLSVQWQPSVCKLRLADGRMMLINYDIDRNRVWLAGGELGSEYIYRDGHWISVQSGTELYADTAVLLDKLVKANSHSAQKGRLDEVSSQSGSRGVDASEASRSRWPYLLLLAALAFIGYRLLMPKPESAAMAPSATMRTAAPDMAVQQCEPNAPASGTHKRFEGVQAAVGGSAEVSISNNHNHGMVVFFTKPGSAIPLQSVYLRSRSRADMPVTPGDYELMFSVGTVWCSLAVGFKDGEVSKLGQRFSLRSGQEVVLELQSTGSQATAFGVFVRNETSAAPVGPPPVQILGDGEMRLQMAADGHYYLQGSVNGRPVDFLVDTGASYTTLKQDIAVAGGIRDCRATQSKTANGIVDVCIGIIPEIRIGAYIVQNAVVVANPKTEANLLGMNVLGQFRIRTENGVMTLSKP